MRVRPKAILIIDDDPEICSILRRYLEHRGYRCLIGYEGRAAVPLVMRHRPDLILMDVGMPGTDGIEACRAVRAAGIRTPLAMLTGQFFPKDRERGLEAGADEYLAKPFDLEEMAQAVKALLRA